MFAVAFLSARSNLTADLLFVLSTTSLCPPFFYYYLFSTYLSIFSIDIARFPHHSSTLRQTLLILVVPFFPFFFTRYQLLRLSSTIEKRLDSKGEEADLYKRKMATVSLIILQKGKEFAKMIIRTKGLNGDIDYVPGKEI